MTLEKLVRVGILFDFYGKLLSERQYTAVELYYIYDLSLAEIGENLDISRQAVYDTLKRAESNLEGFELKLRLVERSYESSKRIKEIGRIVDRVDNIIEDNDIKSELKMVKNIVAEMLNSGQEVVT